MTKAMAALRQFLEKKHWHCQVLDDGSMQGVVIGDQARWTWSAHSSDDSPFLQFHGSSPIDVPMARRPSVLELINRVNFSLRFGGFEMDCDDGEVRFKTAMPLDPHRPPSESHLENLVYANCWAMDRYLPAILAVVYGGEPESALAEAERDDNEEGAAAKDADDDGPAAASRLRILTPSEN